MQPLCSHPTAAPLHLPASICVSADLRQNTCDLGAAAILLLATVHQGSHDSTCLLQAMQGLLVEWLVRYNALLEPSDMETAMRDEVDLALASILAAELCPSTAGILRVLSTAQPAELTAARMCLIQNVHTHGKVPGCSSCVSIQENTTGYRAGQTHRYKSLTLVLEQVYCTVAEHKLVTRVPQRQPVQHSEHAGFYHPSPLAHIFS